MEAGVILIFSESVLGSNTYASSGIVFDCNILIGVFCYGAKKYGLLQFRAKQPSGYVKGILPFRKETARTSDYAGFWAQKNPKWYFWGSLPLVLFGTSKVQTFLHKNKRFAIIKQRKVRLSPVAVVQAGPVEKFRYRLQPDLFHKYIVKNNNNNLSVTF